MREIYNILEVANTYGGHVIYILDLLKNQMRQIQP